MRFVDLTLQAALTTWRQRPDVRERAKADNAWFEERVSAARLATFESSIGGTRDPEALVRSHIQYVRDYMETGEGIPHTFAVELDPAVLSPMGPDPHQWIVRLESLERALSYWPISDERDPFETLRIAHAENNTALIDGFLEMWNDSNVRDFRPAFATWRDRVGAELDADDWADRLRDQLGLEHYNCVNGPIPVAMMQYQVHEVMAAARMLGSTLAFTAPTVLDTKPGPYFFPSPSSLPYGRVMSLTPIASDDDLLAEMLHVRLTYRRDHMVKLGTIRRPPAPHDLKGLRNNHLLALQIASGRDDFGEAI